MGISSGKMWRKGDGDRTRAGHGRACGSTTARLDVASDSRECRLGKTRARADGRGHLKEQFQTANNLIDNYLITFDRKLSLRT